MIYDQNYRRMPKKHRLKLALKFVFFYPLVYYVGCFFFLPDRNLNKDCVSYMPVQKITFVLMNLPEIKEV